MLCMTTVPLIWMNYLNFPLEKILVELETSDSQSNWNNCLFSTNSSNGKLITDMKNYLQNKGQCKVNQFHRKFIYFFYIIMLLKHRAWYFCWFAVDNFDLLRAFAWWCGGYHQIVKSPCFCMVRRFPLGCKNLCCINKHVKITALSF